MRLLCSPPYWELSLTNEVKKYELFAGPEQTIWVAHYLENSPTGHLNTAMVRVFAGSRPFDVRPEEHIWLALFSASSFRDKPLPLKDAGLCLSEPGKIYELAMEERDVSPRLMKWENVRAGERGAARVEGRFRWLKSSARTAHEAFPTESELATYISYGNHDTKPVTISRLVIEDVSPLQTAPRREPQIQGRTVVYDGRMANGASRHYLNYEVMNGKVPPLNASIVQETYRLSLPLARSSTAAFALWVTVVLLGAGLVVSAWRTKKQPKGERTT